VPRQNVRLPSPVTVAIGVACVLLLLRLPTEDLRPIASSETETVVVRRVIDGDTIQLSDGTRVRLLGINSPELAQQDREAEAGALEAFKWLQSEIEGRSITLRYGPERRDSYGRTLAWIYDSDGTLINLQLLTEGHARLVTRFGLPDDLRTDLHQAAARARAAQRGIWKKPG
jgi:micrococcal nuclease